MVYTVNIYRQIIGNDFVTLYPVVVHALLYKVTSNSTAKNLLQTYTANTCRIYNKRL